MRTTALSCLGFLVLLACPARLQAQEEDARAEVDVAGSKDHPMFTRMPGFYIEAYETSDFDSHEFETCTAERSEVDSTAVEGRKTDISYKQKAGQKPLSSLQVVRNYENAAVQAGFVKTCENKDPGNRVLTVKLARGGRQVWAAVECGGGDAYRLVVVEKGDLEQQVTASALLDALQKNGRVALYINFDTAQATLRPDSEPILKEVAEMLRANSALKLAVEGHTDDRGAADANRKLSEQRARAVVAALVGRGIEAARLTAAGFGPDKPLASNADEQGRAKNRRVELVKR